MKGGGKARNDAGYQSSPSTGKGLLVTDELINHARHSADSASVTAQLRPHSFNHLTARTNTFQILLLSAWKHNHTHACTFATRQNRLRLTFIWLCIFISCTHIGVLMDMEEFLGAKLLFFSQFSQSIGHVSGLIAGSSEIVHVQTSRHSTSAKVFSDSLSCIPLCHLALITIYLTFLLSGEVLL